MQEARKSENSLPSVNYPYITVGVTYYVTLLHHHHHHLLYSINPSLCTDTIGCGTCHGGIYNTVKYNHYT